MLSEDDGAMGSVVYLDSMETAIDWLNSRSGRILATTGSKELQAYTAIDDWQERVFARVLSTAESVQHCASIGFEGKHLIAMQGPFPTELNEALLRTYDISYLVTKDTGQAGGFAKSCLPVKPSAVRQSSSADRARRPVFRSWLVKRFWQNGLR